MARLREISAVLTLALGLTACSAPEPSPGAPPATQEIQPLGQAVLGKMIKVVASDGAAGDQLGASVSIHGDLAVVGAPHKGAGAAYAYARNGTTWAVTQKLTAADGASGDTYGITVAMGRETLVVGAGKDDDAGADSGSAYVYARSGTAWSLQAKLTGADSAAGDTFGGAVAVAEGALLIGARADDDGGADSGSAYVFTRSGTTWSQQAKLTGADSAAGDAFGGAVALEAGVALVGASADDDGGTDSGAGFIFHRTGTSWSQQQKVTATSMAAGDALGSGVALRHGFALLGSPGDDDKGSNSGSAHVFKRSGAAWTQQAKLTASSGKAQDQFGASVSLARGAAVVGSAGDDEMTSGAGAAYIFSRDNTAWSERYKVFAPDPDALDGLGSAVSISGDTALLGSPGDDDKGSGSGSAYFQQLCLGQGFAVRVKQTMPGGTSDDIFGSAVATDGEWAMVSAPQDDDQGTDSGTAFIYRRSGTTWNMSQKLQGPGGLAYDNFGNAAAMSGDIAVVGAYHHSGGTERAGAAYVFSRSGNVWINATKLTAADRQIQDNLGHSVAAISGMVMAGVPNDDDLGSSSGSVRVFTGAGASWTQTAKLTAFDGSSSDQFGTSVGLDATSTLVGSPGDDDLGSSSGSAYIFSRSGSTFSILSKLLANDGNSSDQFGASVSLDGEVALVGAPGDDDRGSSSGSAYLFARTGMTWTFQQKLTAPDGNTDANFGANTSLKGTTALVSAPGDHDRGAAYIFTRAGTTWSQLQKLTATSPASLDNFGRHTAMSSDTLVVGSPFDDDKGSDSGSAFFYDLSCGSPAGAPCQFAGSCASGICEDQVCCNGPCGGSGDCQACAKYAGASEDGVCGLAKSGSTCRALSGTCDIVDTCNGVDKNCPLDNVKPPDSICRAAVGSCDVAEKCGGGSPKCPADQFVSSGIVCRADSGDCDVPETCTGTSGTCPADTIKTKGTVCRGAVSSCDVAEVCDGTTKPCPADKLHDATVVCRKANYSCDAEEKCTGTSPLCPNDALASSGTVCRKAAGACDTAETCDGSGPFCPVDKKLGHGASCRAAAGICDVAELCDGTSNDCPSDKMRLNTYVCRTSSGDCDVAEYCTGLVATCPADATEKAGTVCRLGFGLCDKSEACDGTSKTCPTDTLEVAGTVCRKAAGDCDVAESCDGKTSSCPKDGIKSSTTVCRKAAGDCDAAETCDGSSATCPADALASSGTVCRKSVGACDAAETCDGTKSACPGDALKAVGTTCRAASGACDLAETCDGSSALCPADKLSTSGTVCRAASGLCDAPETCDGAAASCPADLLLAAGKLCRKTAGKCDVGEVCDGKVASCPADLYQASGNICRKKIDECDYPEMCSGAAAACPKDNFLPNGTSCLKGAGSCQNGRCMTDAGMADLGSGDAGDLGSSDAEAGMFDADITGSSDGDGMEAGASDSASTDADGLAADVSTSDSAGSDAGQGEGDDEGCSCETGGSGAPGWTLALSLIALGFRRRRRR